MGVRIISQEDGMRINYRIGLCEKEIALIDEQLEVQKLSENPNLGEIQALRAKSSLFYEKIQTMKRWRGDEDADEEE